MHASPDPSRRSIPAPPRRNWIVVACAAHLRRGIGLGIVQVNHGMAAPLRRMAPDDRIAGYAPTEEMGTGPKLRRIMTLGVVAEGPITQDDMGGGFRPWRRPVLWAADARPVDMAALRADPAFALANAAWGARLRFGLAEIDEASMDMIAAAMLGRR